MIEVLPGQLWRWDFNVGTSGAWMLELVTELRRSEPYAQPDVVFIHTGDTFTVVSVDDPGPAKTWGIDLPTYDEYGNIATYPTASATKRWHVVLWNEKLVWFDYDYFLENVCSLIGQP